MERPVSIAVGVVVNAGKILMIKRIKGNFQGLWAMPGGKIETNEHLSDSAIREVREESGIQCEFKSYLGTISEHIVNNEQDIGSQHFLIHLCELIPNSIEIEQGKEGILSWIPLDDIATLKETIIPSDVEMIEKIVKPRKKSYYNCVLEKIGDKYLLKKFESLEKQEKEKIIIDIGSYTVKAYLCTSERISNVMQRSIRLKENYHHETDIPDSIKRELFNIINSIKTRFDKEIKIYSTAIFRDMSDIERKEFEKEFYNTTGLNLNIIDQDKESYYLQLALVGKCSIKDPILLMNTGGGSTQVILVQDKKPIEKINIQIGVATINNMFPGITSDISSISSKEIVNFVKENIPEISTKAKFAFNTGGELSFMRLTKYPIVNNNLFQDRDHPSVISIDAFGKKNKEIFEKFSIKELEQLMPENPSWMHGTRAYLAISQAICEKYGVETIIPSDSNIINGIVRSEFN